MSEPMTIQRVAELAKTSTDTIEDCRAVESYITWFVESRADLLAALERIRRTAKNMDEVCAIARAAIKKAKLPA